ncbi:hypothetical protein QBC37DRAFT_367680 [Rhypophila decipiens]|uniref:Uncharacterized protein n=1 Tax=Rhypophila decipiens TaxID=261697 RepID=A0AAN7BDQ4_9PEZI|nr:hypothetical protein QBC37DRAFT_367680 [Rhypophila decipiens]
MHSAILLTIAALLGQTLAQGVCSSVTDTCFIDGNDYPCDIGGCTGESNCYRENVVGVFPPQYNTYCE